MKTLTYNSPSELEEKTKILLKAYRKSTVMAKADLKKIGVPFTSRMYDLKIDIARAGLRCPPNLVPKDWLGMVLSESEAVRIAAEKICGVEKG